MSAAAEVAEIGPEVAENVETGLEFSATSREIGLAG